MARRDSRREQASRQASKSSAAVDTRIGQPGPQPPQQAVRWTSRGVWTLLVSCTVWLAGWEPLAIVMATALIMFVLFLLIVVSPSIW
jgi:hypothetical protein